MIYMTLIGVHMAICMYSNLLPHSLIIMHKAGVPLSIHLVKQSDTSLSSMKPSQWSDDTEVQNHNNLVGALLQTCKGPGVAALNVDRTKKTESRRLRQAWLIHTQKTCKILGYDQLKHSFFNRKLHTNECACMFLPSDTMQRQKAH